MALVVLITVSSFLFTAEPASPGVSISSVKVFNSKTRRYSTKQQELAFVNFNISADFTPLFNWNTKQLFLYLAADYTNAQGVQNDVVIWDRIVRHKEDAILNVQGKNKYTFRELSTTFRNVPSANYTLKYNVMPYVGALTYGEAGRTTEAVEFPLSQSRMS